MSEWTVFTVERKMLSTRGWEHFHETWSVRFDDRGQPYVESALETLLMRAMFSTPLTTSSAKIQGSLTHLG